MAGTRSEMQGAVGHCILAWANIESALAQIFCHLTGLKVSMAAGILGEVISFRAKLSVINAVVIRRVRNKKTLANWQALYNRLHKKHKKRNEIAHSGLVLAGNAPDVPDPKFGLMPYRSIDAVPEFTPALSLKEVKERAESFDLLGYDVWVFYLRLPGLPPIYRRIATRLARELRAQSGQSRKEPQAQP